MSVHSVTSLMAALEAVLEAEPRLQALTVRGEISDYRRSSAGHLYFTLKDEGAEIKCVMFQNAAMYLKFPPSNGLQVVLQGGVELYGTRGQIQLRVRKMQPDGPGALRLRLEELRKKLEGEGLFAPERKRGLPVLPVKVGIVSSRQAAVVRDIATTLWRRNGAVQLFLVDAPVQGPEAPPRLIRALERLAEYGVDCVILARGGGSLEDLMAFNDEELVRAVAACPVPVVSAIGHQTDFTLCDLAADRRAPTPTAAAEMVAGERAEMLRSLDLCRTRLRRALERQLQSHRERLRSLQESPCLRYPERLARPARQELELLAGRLDRFRTQRLPLERERLRHLEAAVQARHPRRLAGAERARLDDLAARLGRPLRLRASLERTALAQLAPRLEPALRRGLVLRRERLEGLRQALRAPDATRAREQLAQLHLRLVRGAEDGLRTRRAELSALLLPPPPLAELRRALEGLAARLAPAQARALELRRQRLVGLAGRLDALSPLKVLERGYTYARDARGQLVRSVAGRQPGERLDLHLADGVLGVRVEQVRRSDDLS